MQTIAQITGAGDNIVKPLMIRRGERGPYGSIEGHMAGLYNFFSDVTEKDNLLTGHSLGGLASILFASENEVSRILLISPQMGGRYDFRISRRNYRESMHYWRNTGYQVRRDQSGNEYHLPWREYWKESFRYNAFERAAKIKGRVCVIAGKGDPYVDISLLRDFVNVCGNSAKLIEIECPHVPKDAGELKILGDAIRTAKEYLS
ncbi:MAG: alpha/beta hydrolase [Candidatus Gracilibacteria bacterium]|nr:alpha/beta hydrolase [Candidatus Gracilibacteria bacterium]